MRIAIAQLDCVVGDIPGNAARILAAAEEAGRGGADLVVTPELSLCGYPPEDLLLRPAFLTACAEELERLAARVRGPAGAGGFSGTRGGARGKPAGPPPGRPGAADFPQPGRPHYPGFRQKRHLRPRPE